MLTLQSPDGHLTQAVPHKPARNLQMVICSSQSIISSRSRVLLQMTAAFCLGFLFIFFKLAFNFERCYEIIPGILHCRCLKTKYQKHVSLQHLYPVKEIETSKSEAHRKQLTAGASGLAGEQMCTMQGTHILSIRGLNRLYITASDDCPEVSNSFLLFQGGGQ